MKRGVQEVEAALAAHPSRKDAIIVGIEAHVCALQSTYDLIERGVSEPLPGAGSACSAL